MCLIAIFSIRLRSGHDARGSALTVHVVTGIKQLEVSAQAMAAAAALAGRMALYGGAALIMDYGRDEPYPVRSLRNACRNRALLHRVNAAVLI